jgi:hypothetical protein
MQVWLLLVVYIHSCAVTGDLVTCHQHIVKLALRSVCIETECRANRANDKDTIAITGNILLWIAEKVALFSS